MGGRPGRPKKSDDQSFRALEEPVGLHLDQKENARTAPRRRIPMARIHMARIHMARMKMVPIWC